MRAQYRRSVLCRKKDQRDGVVTSLSFAWLVRSILSVAHFAREEKGGREGCALLVGPSSMLMLLLREANK